MHLTSGSKLQSSSPLALMSCQPTRTAISENFTAIPAQWDDDPTAQLRALRDEVLRQRQFPTSDTYAFMAAAWDAIEHLPSDYFPPERAETLSDISRFYYLHGDTEPEIKAASAAVQAAMSGGHRLLEGQARSRLGIGLRHWFDFIGSITELGRAVEIAREQGDAIWEAKFLNSLANSYNDAGIFQEALEIFERVADVFAAHDDPLSAWMALDNAALAALRLRDIPRGSQLARRAKAAWSGEPHTADEKLWVVQGALTNCQLLVLSDRAAEALESARTTRAIAVASGLGAAEELAGIGETMAAYAAGLAGIDAFERLIEQARGAPSQYSIALNAAIRTYEWAGRFDEALNLQRQLIDFNRRQKFGAVHRLLGRPSFEEIDGEAVLARFGIEVDRKVSDLINAAINQSLRAGYDHARIFRVSRLAELFALSENRSPEATREIALAAKLIDIGNMVIPDDLLSKPHALSEGESKIVADHASFGADLLVSAQLSLLEPCAQIVRFHHERWDGTGPTGLQAERIPLGARIVTLCDSFDALTHDRPWRRAFLMHQVLQSISEESGTRFDPRLAERFVAW